MFASMCVNSLDLIMDVCIILSSIVDGNTLFEKFNTMFENKLDELSDLRKGHYIASINLHQDPHQ